MRCIACCSPSLLVILYHHGVAIIREGYCVDQAFTRPRSDTELNYIVDRRPWVCFGGAVFLDWRSLDGHCAIWKFCPQALVQVSLHLYIRQLCSLTDECFCWFQAGAIADSNHIGNFGSSHPEIPNYSQRCTNFYFDGVMRWPRFDFSRYRIFHFGM